MYKLFEIMKKLLAVSVIVLVGVTYYKRKTSINYFLKKTEEKCEALECFIYGKNNSSNFYEKKY